jgi:hypothetical protein
MLVKARSIAEATNQREIVETIDRALRAR